MSKIQGLVLSPTYVLPRAADPDPTNFMPSGPNFQLFAGLAPSIQWLIGVILAIVFFIGLFLFLHGLTQFRTRNRDIGEGAKGARGMLTGGIMMLASFIAVPIINQIIHIAQSAGTSIH